MLLLLNTAIALPCVAAVKYQQHLHNQQQQQQGPQQNGANNKDEQQEQQQQPESADMFCGFSFSRHPQQHIQLQKLVMDVGIEAGQQLAVRLTLAQAGLGPA